MCTRGNLYSSDQFSRNYSNDCLNWYWDKQNNNNKWYPSLGWKGSLCKYNRLSVVKKSLKLNELRISKLWSHDFIQITHKCFAITRTQKGYTFKSMIKLKLKIHWPKWCVDQGAKGFKSANIHTLYYIYLSIYLVSKIDIWSW